jgi:hypothetical protein
VEERRIDGMNAGEERRGEERRGEDGMREGIDASAVKSIESV